VVVSPDCTLAFQTRADIFPGTFPSLNCILIIFRFTAASNPVFGAVSRKFTIPGYAPG
jgi:hypothetical protein